MGSLPHLQLIVQNQTWAYSSNPTLVDGGLLLVHMCVSNCVSIVITSTNIILLTTIINIIILSFFIVLTCDFASNSADAWSPPSRRLEICHLDLDGDDNDDDLYI